MRRFLLIFLSSACISVVLGQWSRNRLRNWASSPFYGSPRLFSSSRRASIGLGNQYRFSNPSRPLSFSSSTRWGGSKPLSLGNQWLIGNRRFGASGLSNSLGKLPPRLPHVSVLPLTSLPLRPAAELVITVPNTESHRLPRLLEPDNTIHERGEVPDWSVQEPSTALASAPSVLFGAELGNDAPPAPILVPDQLHNKLPALLPPQPNPIGLPASLPALEQPIPLQPASALPFPNTESHRLLAPSTQIIKEVHHHHYHHHHHGRNPNPGSPLKPGQALLVRKVPRKPLSVRLPGFEGSHSVLVAERLPIGAALSQVLKPQRPVPRQPHRPVARPAHFQPLSTAQRIF